MRHATHSKLKEKDSSWLPQLQWHQNCAAFEGWVPKVNLLRLGPVLNKWCKLQRGFAARIKQTPYENSLLFYNQTSMQQKNIKTIKTKAICTVYHCLSTYVRSITRYNSGFSLRCRCLFVVFCQASGYQKLTELGAATLRKARGEKPRGGETWMTCKERWRVLMMMVYGTRRPSEIVGWILVLSWVSYIKLSKCYKIINYCSHWYCPFVVHLSLFLLLFL